VIVNLEEGGVGELLEAVSGVPAGSEIVARLRSGEEPFFVAVGPSGFEWGVFNEVRGVANRARLKLFTPAERDDLAVVLAYKPSQVSWSHDRYAYGVWEVPVDNGEAAVDTAELESWIAFQVSGFHPETRPRSLVRQISYDIP
jgi:hypothetical protein